MYRHFYGLTRVPFGISPDPFFYCPTPRHNEALANLAYGIQRRKGFVVLTGEVGTGKTLLVRYLINTLVRAKVQYAYVFNPHLTPTDFMQFVLATFGIKNPQSTRGAMLQQFQDFLIEVNRNGQTAALLVDEAHLLTAELLEEIRLLTNIETPEYKLLQIVFVGQPELDDLLDSPELRQLKQRVALRCHLPPLEENDVHGYIVRRLELAGAGERAKTIFPRPTVERIFFHSRGTPRVINHLCDGALLTGYARRESVIKPEIIDEIATDLRLNVTTMSRPGATSKNKEGASIR